jgi:hypothetical protein
VSRVKKESIFPCGVPLYCMLHAGGDGALDAYCLAVLSEGGFKEWVIQSRPLSSRLQKCRQGKDRPGTFAT